jgi:hypothetical protein
MPRWVARLHLVVGILAIVIGSIWSGRDRLLPPIRPAVSDQSDAVGLSGRGLAALGLIAVLASRRMS